MSTSARDEGRKSYSFIYRDAQGVITARTILDPRPDGDVVRGFCTTRNEERSFRHDRILEVISPGMSLDERLEWHLENSESSAPEHTFHGAGAGARLKRGLEGSEKARAVSNSSGAIRFLHGFMLVVTVVAGIATAGLLAVPMIVAWVFLVRAATKSAARMKEEVYREIAEAMDGRRAALARQFGPSTAARIMSGTIRMGDPKEVVVEALGAPEDASERVLKTKTKETLKYGKRSARSFDIKITLENGRVTGWDA